MRKIVPLVLSLFSLLFNSSTPSLYQNPLLQHELASLDERGVTYRMLPGNTLEVTDPRSGQQWMFDVERLLTPHKPTYDTIPTLTVDLATIDTSFYNWKYHHISDIPVSGIEGYGLLSGDLNQNGRPEVYGIYVPQFQDGSTRIYELNDSGSWNLQYVYPFRIGVVENIDDMDRNERIEVFARNADSLYVFEQPDKHSFPTTSKFRYRLSYDGGIGIPNELGDMDNDGRKELVYRGSERDTADLINQRNYIARYDTTLGNFVKIWNHHLGLDCGGGECTPNGMAIGDYDGDNLPEFVTSMYLGNVFDVEYVSGDSFRVAWIDSLSTAGRAGSGDVDGNGIAEFFVGGNQVESDGYVHMRIYAYERTGNDSFAPFFSFNIFPVGLFSADLYQTADVEGDGQKELLISFGGGVLILKGSGTHQYHLFYYKTVLNADGFSASDITSDGVAELFVSRFYLGNGVYTHTEVYQLDSTLVGVHSDMDHLPSAFVLFQNYPNPFNPTTSIEYSIPSDAFVSLVIYDMLGSEVAVLEQSAMKAGLHNATFDGSHFASGVYMYKLSVGGFSKVRKMLLMK